MPNYRRAREVLVGNAHSTKLNQRIDAPRGIMKKDARKSPAVLRRADVLKIIEAHMADIRRFGVRSIGLFGSYAKNGGHETSDMDFLVRFEAPTFDNYMELKFLLERLFRKKVDIVMEETLKPALRYVKKEAVYAKVA